VHNIEMRPGKGGQKVRAAGVGAQLLAKEGSYATLRLPSGEVRKVLLETRAELCSILDEHQCKRFDELSLMPGADPEFRGAGRCLEDEPDRGNRRGRGRDRERGIKPGRR